MADQKQSEFPNADALAGTEKVPVLQAGNKNSTPAAFLAYIRSLLNDADVPAEVVTEAGSSRTLALTDRGKYMRWTGAGAKALAVNTDTGGAIGEYHIRNAAASGDLTLIASGVTITAPKGGSLVLEPGDTVTLKRVGTNVFDLFGSTKAA